MLWIKSDVITDEIAAELAAVQIAPVAQPADLRELLEKLQRDNAANEAARQADAERARQLAIANEVARQADVAKLQEETRRTQSSLQAAVNLACSEMRKTNAAVGRIEYLIEEAPVLTFTYHQEPNALSVIGYIISLKNGSITLAELGASKRFIDEKLPSLDAILQNPANPLYPEAKKLRTDLLTLLYVKGDDDVKTVLRPIMV